MAQNASKLSAKITFNTKAASGQNSNFYLNAVHACTVHIFDNSKN
jgi:hypothetical protein